MADDSITLVSTTDTPEQVQAALTGKPAETPKTETPEKKSDTTDPPATETPADTDATPAETPDQKAERETREASAAGGRLAKRKQSIQEEIDELTRNKHNVRRDVEAEEARLSEVRRQRADAEAAAGKPDAKPDAKVPDGKTDDSRPEPKLDATDDKGTAKYGTYEDYLSDHAKWTREQAVLDAKQVLEQDKQAERERIDRDSANRAVNQHLAGYNGKLEEFKKTHADFDAAFEDAKEAVRDTLVALGPQALKVIDGYTVFDAEDGPALTYYLLKRPDELKAIAMKSPQQQIVHLARLEERIRPGGVKKPGPPSQPATETKAPAPIKPVGSGPTATTVAPEDESYQDFKARRERELRAKRPA